LIFLDRFLLAEYIFGFCEIVCEDAPHNNICGSIKIVYFGYMNQKLWVF
jgi:hypothetical protein